jgi:hypothetical protein
MRAEAGDESVTELAQEAKQTQKKIDEAVESEDSAERSERKPS